MALAKPSAMPTDPNGVQKPVTNSVSSVGSKSSTQNRNGQYRRAQIETASPTRLVVLLYDGAIRFCALAADAMVKRDLETQNTNLIKAQRIISELMGSLNREVGGEVADNLFRIYVHMLEQLVRANLYDQVDTVKAVQRMLESLRETWVEVDRITTGGDKAATGINSLPATRAMSVAPQKPVQPAPAIGNRGLRLGDRSA